MSRWMKRPDIPFNREDANRYLPWVIAVMVCLAGLLLAAGISLHQASQQSGRLNIRSFQVYIPHHKVSSVLIDTVSDSLADTNQVKMIEPLTNRMLEGLISPWTGGSLSLEELPLPTVLEVTLKDGVDRKETVSQIAARLKAIDPALDVETYQDWVDQLTQFTQMLRFGVFALVALLFAALMALVVVVVRTSLRLHFHAVRLLHTIGATDDYIVQQFVLNGCLMVLKGSAMGMGLASVIAVFTSYFSMELASPILPEISLSWVHVMMLIGLPVFMVLLTALLVRITMMKMLQQMH